MRVVERFVSINGEGPRAGELAVFVRFQGCNLQCSYCDTRWANDPGCPFEDRSPQEIADEIRWDGIRNVALTGGEPLLQPDMPLLLARLAEIPGDRQVLPGHGPSTTLADERLSNPYMRRALRK